MPKLAKQGSCKTIIPQGKMLACKGIFVLRFDGAGAWNAQGGKAAETCEVRLLQDHYTARKNACLQGHFCAAVQWCRCVERTRRQSRQNLRSKTSAKPLYRKEKCLLARAFLCCGSMVQVRGTHKAAKPPRLAKQGFCKTIIAQKTLYNKKNYCNKRHTQFYYKKHRNFL